MGLLDLFRRRPTAPAAALPAPAPALTPDGSEFERANEAVGFGRAGRGLSAHSLLALAATAGGYVTERTRPEEVPFDLIESMRFDPWIYIGERMFAAPLQDPSLYVVKHSDPAIKAETEAWLRKLLPILLREITRAFALGSSPYVLDWEASDLSFEVSRPGASPFTRRLAAHQHFAEIVHRIRNSEASLEVFSDRLVALRYNGRSYRPDRAFVSVWDDERKDWRGNGSRLRAWRSYYTSMFTGRMESRWIERGVDPPRIGYAPTGTLKINGETVPATELLTAALMALKGGDAAVLPGDRDPETKERIWSIAAMELPDVHKVWRSRMDALAAEKLLSSLAPPSSAGVGGESFAAARIPNEMFVELIESAAAWVAQEVECVVDVVHKINHPRKEAPEVIAREIPKAKVRRLVDVFKAVSGAQRRVGEGQEVTLAELVDESILDEAGIPRRATEEAARAPREESAPGSPGRPSEGLSDRQDRRDGAREPEGEDATGAPDEGVDS